MAVLRPVPMTTPRALPAATLVPENKIFFLSYKGKKMKIKITTQN